MRLRNVTGSREMIGESRFVVHEPEQQKGMWRSAFGNDRPVYVEIGMGKGRFLMDMARLNPEINFIGIEKYSNCPFCGRFRSWKRRSCRTCGCCAWTRRISENVFADGELDRIYLNFSDPWPKDRHAKRRLESRQFLARYDKILKKDVERSSLRRITVRCSILRWKK